MESPLYTQNFRRTGRLSECLPMRIWAIPRLGHNALGAGRVFDQGAKLVAKSIESGAIFKTDLWHKAGCSRSEGHR